MDDELDAYYLNIAKQMEIKFIDSPIVTFFKQGHTLDKSKKNLPDFFKKLDEIISQCEGNFANVPYKHKNNFEETLNNIFHYTLFPQGIMPSGGNYPHTWGE